MDTSSLSQSNLDLSKLSDYDKRDLQQQIGNEMQKAKIQECKSPLFSFRPCIYPPLPPFFLLPFSPPFHPTPTHPTSQSIKSVEINGNIAIHNLTDICWTKCITGGISSGKMSGKEESCAANCVERFLEANTAVLKHLERMRGEM